ncbi:hypothetical protein LAZ67_1007408 [Cordylochernes scorpioides]|uniref:Mos1 transposase HTH domain-containing protein n=1 Tax=Cordylochernes scorpioides TaxID=51811 RepID=A0ABY6JZI3_9ARAC|nr:hypothetical protein LAZ67_1007408 [Cordylochernes scorpioides]
MHRPEIEPGAPAWQASILPLNQKQTDCTTLEQHAVIRFLNAEGIQTSQICQKMKNIYGESCLSKKKHL